MKIPGKKGEAYCFGCNEVFVIIDENDPCPNCGSDRWSADPEDSP